MDLSVSLAEFGWDMCKELLKTNCDSNILISPASIASALCLLTVGANGNTKAQLKKLLHFPDPGHATSSPEAGSSECGGEQTETKSGQEGRETEVLNQIKELLSKLKSEGGTELKMANILFTKDDFPILPTYKTSAQAVFNANVKSVDFGKDEARKEINAWFEKETNSKIKDFYSTNSLSKNASMVLANATYFKGFWEKQFKKEDTKEGPFKVKEGVIKTVPMMSQTEKFYYADLEAVNAQVLQLPYVNGELCMFIILPKESTTVEKVIEQMTFKKLAECINPKNLKETKVEVKIPRFKIEEKYNLTSPLQNMGMTDAFSNQADFSNISNTGLFLSQMEHKAVIEVNEEGSEAAAATGAVLMPTSFIHPVKFHAKHPFMFLIMHNPTKAILFTAKLTSP